jgi:hypothetical protein
VCQRNPLTQQSLHFIDARFGMLIADAIARDFAGKLVQIKRQPQSFFASHGTIFFNLCVKRCLWRHEKILTRVDGERTIFCIGMDDLALADFAFKDVDAKRVEDFFLNRALERARTVNRIVTLARDQLLGRIGKLERDLFCCSSRFVRRPS